MQKNLLFSEKRHGKTRLLMKSSITGAEFNAMESVDISVDGFLVDSEEGSDPVSAWGMVQ